MEQFAVQPVQATTLENLKKPKSHARRLLELSAIAGIISIPFVFTACDDFGGGLPQGAQLESPTKQAQAPTIQQIVNQAINPNNLV